MSRARRGGGGMVRTCGKCHRNPATTTVPPAREGGAEVPACVSCWQAEYRRLADEKRKDREAQR